MKVILDEIVAGWESSDMPRQERGWKALLLLPRMLLHRKCRGGPVSKEKFKQRFEDFQGGRWGNLLIASITNDEDAATATIRKRRTQNHGDVEHRVNRVLSRVQMRELSAGRQALEGAELAPGNAEILRQLRLRPSTPRELLPHHITHHVSERPFELDEKKFAANLRSSRRGTAGGPSGKTNEHLRPLLNNSRVMHTFFRVAESEESWRAMSSAGWWREPSPSSWARLLRAQQPHSTCTPVLDRVGSRSNCPVNRRDKCLRSHLQEGDVVRSGQRVPGGDQVLPFVTDSTVLDEMGIVHVVDQGEGGEQGDALMPLLFCLGQNDALKAVQASLRPSERLFAFLDDIYIVCKPDRVDDVHTLLENALWDHARIQVHVGKTKVYNRAGVCPEACDRLERRARLATQGAGVERRPRRESGGAWNQSSWHSVGPPNVCDDPVATHPPGSTVVVGPDPPSARRAISVGDFGALGVGSSNLFLEGGVPRAVFPVRHISRHRVVGVSGNSGGSPHAAHQKHHPRVSVSPSGIWRTGFEKRCAHGSGSLLGQLG